MTGMIKTLFEKQQRYLNYFFSHIDLVHCEKIISKILEAKGVLFFTGVGKSGFIAQKVAATLLSTGSKAFFLHPIDALHGDLGMVSKEDMVLIFSKSGETEELLHLLPYLRNKGAQILAITSTPNSSLGKGSDFSLILPCENELCPFDLAPTISAEIQLLFGDVLAVALMDAKRFSLDDYVFNHPGGRIGRRISMKVRDLMLDKERTPICLGENLLEEVLVDFSDKRCGCMIVVDEKRRLKGIFTDGDLRRALQLKGERVLKEKIGDLMTLAPKMIEAEESAWEALKKMEGDQKQPIMVLPVVEDQEVVGIIKMHDLIQAGL